MSHANGTLEHIMNEPSLEHLCAKTETQLKPKELNETGKKSIFGCLNESSQNIAHPVGTENIDTPPVLRGIHSRFPQCIGRLWNVGHAHGTIRLQIAQPERILPCAMPACLVCPHLDNGRMSPHFPRNESLWCGTHPVFFPTSSFKK